MEWAICFAYAAGAIFFIYGGVFSELYGTTPKEKIVRVAGVAEGGNISTVKGRYGDSTEYIHFRVGPHVVSYASRRGSIEWYML